MSREITDKLDYYELFGIDETASDVDIKKAYYRLARQWHPDRNPSNVEEATRVFQIIEHAYSILSDPHERAWYDGHKTNVVEDNGFGRATTVDINSLFEIGAWSGYSSSPTGFYGVFSRAFTQIGDEEKIKTPPFGDENSSFEDVDEFYKFWTCFTTKRSFSFNEKWNLNDADDARMRRAMKQENEKLKKQAEREFLASVRELAYFVRKRDPRVAKHSAEIARLKQEKEEIDRKLREERLRKVEEEMAEYAKMPTRELSEEDLVYVRQFDKSADEPIWRCEYCNRDMNTEKAFRQHCKTKKHRKGISNARRDFMKDPSSFGQSLFNYVLYDLTPEEIHLVTDEDVSLDDRIPPSKGRLPDEESGVDEEEEKTSEKQVSSEEIDEEQTETLQKPMSKKEKRKMQQKAAKKGTTNATVEEDDVLSQKGTEKEKEEPKKPDADMMGSKLSKKERKRLQQMEQMRKQLLEVEEEDSSESEDAIPESEASQTESDKKVEPENPPLSKKAKARQERREKRAAKKNTAGQFMCRTCRACFPSKTKLFEHLRETDHATARK